jgi:hypothetical protein
VLLENFEQSLENLTKVPLHPSLRLAIESYAAHMLNMQGSTSAGGGGGGGSGGGVNTAGSSASTAAAGGGIAGVSPQPSQPLLNATATGTLIDCIPVDRERAFLVQCVANHKKVCVVLCLCPFFQCTFCRVMCGKSKRILSILHCAL